MRALVPQWQLVLEHNERSRAHESTRGRAVVLEHLLESAPEQGQIVSGEPGLGRKLRRDEPMGQVEAVRDAVLPAHRPVVTLLAVGLTLCRDRQAGGGMFQR